MPSGLGMAHGEKKKVWGLSGGTKLDQLGGHTLPTLMVISYRKEAMAHQRYVRTSLKQQGSNQCSQAGYLLCLCQAPGRSDWLLVREWDRVFGD